MLVNFSRLFVSSVFDDFKLEIYEESLDEESSLDSPDEGKDEEKAA